MLNVLGFIVIALLSLLLAWYYNHWQFEKYLKHFAGIRPLPLMGNALDFQKPAEIIPSALRYQRICKGNFKMYVGFQAHLFLTKPAEIEFLLNSTTLLEKSQPYEHLHNWLGTGLLTASVEKWKKHRKIITPAFHFQILEDFVEIFNRASDVLARKLDKEVETHSVNIYSYITLCTLDIICESAMGTSVNAQEDSDSNYVRSVQTMLKVLTKRGFSPYLRYNFFYQFSSLYQEEQAALKVLHGYTSSVINRRRCEFLNGKDKENEDDFGRRKRRAFLDSLLQYSMDSQMLTDDEIRQEVDTFMFEGNDTTATTMSFTLYCLANNGDVQAKVHEEIKNIFLGDPNRLPNYRDLQDMRYLEMVIKESLRMYPAAPLYSRKITEDVSCNGKILPKGLMVNVFCYGLHHDPDIFPNPEKFDPERFSTENAKNRHPYAYVPFSAGSRNCIGQKFAMVEMKTVLSHLLRRFEFLPVPEHKIVLNSEAVLKSATGVLVRFQKRF